MASYNPPEDEIDTFQAIAPDLNRREIILRIKGNSNNVQFAINEYFEEPQSSNKYDTTWNDGYFGGDRDGGGDLQQNNTTFKIHAPDETGTYERRDPQTRPPSRANNQSPLGKVIDLTSEHANADRTTSMDHDDESDLQRAIEASRAFAGLAPQESGITSGGNGAFGPATRSQYEESEWGMVTVGNSSAREILLDPEPAARKRDLNVPAFLKPSVENHRIAALLTIYHEIPLIREVFLNRSDVQQNYGHDSEWWSGKAIETPFVEGSQPSDSQQVIYEIQRLMAFLDKTDRSYGSADALANLPAVKKMKNLLSRGRGGSNGDSLEAATLIAWKKAFENRETGSVGKLFSIGLDGEEETNSDEFAILDLAQPGKDSGLETFYDITDQMLWPHPETDVTKCAYLDHIGDVIAFRFDDSNAPSNSFDVPSVWYPDRYLKSGRQAALDMRMRKAEIQEEVRKITRQQDTLTEVCHKGKILKVTDMFKAALQHEVEEDDEDYPSVDQSFLGEDEVRAQVQSENAAKLSADLGKLMASIDKKLLDLNSQKDKARDSLRQLSKLYTESSSDSTQPPTHKYTLRGVSTTNSTTYICRSAERDLIDMELDDEGSALNRDQWWRIDYSSGSHPVIVEKTTEEKVLAAAKTESKDIILIYASVKAMQFESKPLPLQLENFVRHDNILFARELDSTIENQESPVTSPGKRKFASQTDSEFEDSTRWNGGSSPRGYDNSVQIMERELKPDDDVNQSRTVSPDEIGEVEVIDGVEPSLHDNRSGFSGQEMQERGGMRMLSRTEAGTVATIDSMDMDQIMEDEVTTEESAAVKHVELA